MENQIQFSHGKKRTREELRLPQLHFVAVDNWVETIGDTAFVAWLKFYSWADRVDKDRENDTIPKTINTIIKKLGMAKATFYKNVIRPLWEYGFIDLIETPFKGYSYVNIIVYEYPQNDPDRSTRHLQKVRDYDTEYKSQARTKAIQVTNSRQKTNSETNKNATSGHNTSNTHFIRKWGSSKFELGRAVQNLNRMQFKKRTGGGSKFEPINTNYKENSNYPNNDPNNNRKNVAVVAHKIELHLRNSIKTLLPLLSSWIEEYGEEYLIEKAQYIGARNDWRNIVGAYREAVTKDYQTVWAEITVTKEKSVNETNDRYQAFYNLFPDARC